MCKKCGSKSSEAFRLELKSLIESGSVPPLATYKTLSKFQQIIELHSVKYVSESGQIHWGRYDDFGTGWSDPQLFWIIRHLTHTPEDMEYARNLMLVAREKYLKEQEKRSPFFGMKKIPL